MAEHLRAAVDHLVRQISQTCSWPRAFDALTLARRYIRAPYSFNCAPEPGWCVRPWSEGVNHVCKVGK